LVCLVLIGLVLLQQGKGADVGAAFGGGSNTLFGASGAGSFIGRLTTGIAILFMACSIVLARQYIHRSEIGAGVREIDPLAGSKLVDTPAAGAKSATDEKPIPAPAAEKKGQPVPQSAAPKSDDEGAKPK
jgi:preprotein translocase subunit SecG